MALSSIVTAIALSALLCVVIITLIRVVSRPRTRDVPVTGSAVVSSSPLTRAVAERRVSTPGIFVSYSRKDSSLVRTIIALYRITDSRVFLDQESITPGRQWRVVTDEALADCRTVLVFWCAH